MAVASIRRRASLLAVSSCLAALLGLTAAPPATAAPTTASPLPTAESSDGPELSTRVLNPGDELSITDVGWGKLTPCKGSGLYGSVIGYRIYAVGSDAPLGRVDPYVQINPDTDPRNDAAGQPVSLSDDVWAFGTGNVPGQPTGFTTTFRIPDGTTSGSDLSSTVALTPGDYWVEISSGPWGGFGSSCWITPPYERLFDQTRTIGSPETTGFTVYAEGTEPLTYSDSIGVTTSIPTGPGALALELEGTVSNLSNAERTSDGYLATGYLPLMAVIDTRTQHPGWSLVVSSTDLTGPDGAHISRSAIGVAPSAISAEGPAVKAGERVAPGSDGGLSESRLLAYAPAGASRGKAVIRTALRAELPSTAVAGTYRATVTVTLS